VWICSQIFNRLVDVLLSFISNSIVHRYIDNLYDTSMRRAASFRTELLLIRVAKLQQHNNESRLLSDNEIDIIMHICIS
jgi:hypothetical protein